MAKTVQGKGSAQMLATSKLPFSLLALALLGASSETEPDTPSSESPQYTADAQLKFPEHHREWVYLTSDFYASSDPAKMQTSQQRKFNNIFVNPEAYRAYLQTGTWPDKTMLIVEQREADDMDSANPNQKGNVQRS